MIIGHKEIEDLKKFQSFRNLEEFSGSSVEILPEDPVFSSMIDAIGAPYSMGSPNKVKDVTVIIYGDEIK